MFFHQNLIDIVLKRDQYVVQSKKYHLIFKMAIVNPKSRFLFITFSDLYRIISISSVELGKTLSSI